MPVAQTSKAHLCIQHMPSPPSNTSDESFSSVSAQSTMSTASDQFDEVIPPSNTVLSFYQKSTMITGRQVPVKHPRRGQGHFVFQKTVKTEEMVIQNTATPPTIMLVKDQGVAPNEKLPTAVAPIASVPAAVPQGVPILNPFFRPNRTANAPGPSNKRARRPSMANAEHPGRNILPTALAPIASVPAAVPQGVPILDPFFRPNRTANAPGPSNKRARRPSVADAEHPGRKYILISNDGGRKAKAKEVIPAVRRNTTPVRRNAAPVGCKFAPAVRHNASTAIEREVAPGVERAATAPEHADELGSPIVLVEDSENAFSA
ncbi:hypothetical protein BJ912DRAFT_1056298 [Pholiota molesta]|nr:hypothetical protein BJ912DRAFT_1056298 [Pholiota molesta]